MLDNLVNNEVFLGFIAMPFLVSIAQYSVYFAVRDFLLCNIVFEYGQDVLLKIPDLNSCHLWFIQRVLFAYWCAQT